LRIKNGNENVLGNPRHTIVCRLPPAFRPPASNQEAPCSARGGFALNNVGRCPITDIALSVSDSTYSISPSRIDTLLPGNDIKMLPVIRVVAYHGTPMDGPGTRALLPRGENELTMTVSGTTKTRSGVDTTIYVSADLRLVALVMDFQIHSLLSGPYKIPNTISSRTEMKFPDTSYQNFSSTVHIDPMDTIITLNNTGNVPLNCKIYGSDTLPSHRISEKLTRELAS
jgi:hypothetical protein